MRSSRCRKGAAPADGSWAALRVSTVLRGRTSSSRRRDVILILTRAPAAPAPLAGAGELVAADDAVERGALCGGSPGAVGGADQLLGLEPDSVIGARHAADRLLHQRAAEIVCAPAQ